MAAVIIIQTGGQLVTCASPNAPKKGGAMMDVGIIDGGAVAIRDGLIVDVGVASHVRERHHEAEIFDAGGNAICPAFVDPHSHIVFAGHRLDEFEQKLRGDDYMAILQRGGGILSTVRSTRAAGFDDLVVQSRARLDKMMRCGSATIEIKTGYGLNSESEMLMLSVIEELDRLAPVRIVPTFLAAHAIPTEFSDDPDAYVRLICDDMLPRARAWYDGSRFAAKRTPFFVDVFCEQNAFSLKQTAAIMEAAKNIGFSVKAHVDEFSNLGGTRLAVEAGATSVDHLDKISDAEVEMLALSPTVGVVTPTVNFNLGSRDFADARKLIDAGCAIALSTDFNPGSSPCPSQQTVMAIACRYQRLLPAEALNAATINAAYAVGLGDQTGSLEVGKAADLMIVNAGDYRQLAYEFGSNNIHTVFINGVNVWSANKNEPG